MTEIAALVEKYPGIAAVIVAMLFSAAIAFEDATLRSKGMAGLSLVIGLLGLVGCLAGALKTGLFDIALVVISAIALVSVAYRVRTKRTAKSETK